MRINSALSIRTANIVHDRFGSWQAARAAASIEDGKFVVRSSQTGQAGDAMRKARSALKPA